MLQTPGLRRTRMVSTPTCNTPLVHAPIIIIIGSQLSIADRFSGGALRKTALKRFLRQRGL
jgi:hypothetical protein